MTKIGKYIFIAAAAAFLASPSQAQPFEKYRVKVEEILNHDSKSYTQGLFFHNGQLYESAGQYGESSMRKVDLKTGKVQKRKDYERKYFAEGSCMLGNRLYLLTWREKTCFICNPDTFEKLGEFRYPTEGWGLTTDGKSLIMSDGSDKIYFRDPRNFVTTRTLSVTANGKPVNLLNELEYINGEIWANVYTSDFIVIINPETGNVRAVVDCTDLLPRNLRKPETDVLNGIAYNPADGKIYLTGKYWPKMYRVTLK